MSTATTELKPSQTNTLRDRDIHLGLEMNSPPDFAPVVTASRLQPAMIEPAVVIPPPPPSRARARLLAMADAYLRSGSLHQALEMYFDLMSDFPESAEAVQAEERTLEVASQHEQAGEMRLARAIYERLA